MSTLPSTCPSGNHTWPKITEYAAIKNAPRSHKTVMKIVGKYTLHHATAGYEPAGSMARWTKEYYAVVFTLDGAEHGQRFRTAQEAYDLLNRWVQRSSR